jgi:hypothetical protein
MWTWILSTVGVLAAGMAVWRMLGRVTARGGEQGGDAAERASQIIAQAEAFRGGATDDRQGWDGEERLKGVQGTDGASA